MDNQYTTNINELIIPEKALRILIGHRPRRHGVTCIKDMETLWRRHRSDSNDTFEKFIKKTKNDLSIECSTYNIKVNNERNPDK